MKALINKMMIVMLAAVLVASEAAAPPNAPPSPSSPTPPGPPGETCNVLKLVPCLIPYTFKTNPPPECCNALKAQESCFCKYMKDPNLQKFMDSPNGKNIATACSIPPPKCS